MKDSFCDSILTSGSHTVFAQILRSNINLTIFPLQGVGNDIVDDAPVFPYVWEKIAPHIEGLPLVAHNARFDERCLKAAFRTYQMDYPDYVFYDTLKASRDYFGYNLPNHQLQTVAEACGADRISTTPAYISATSPTPGAA